MPKESKGKKAPVVPIDKKRPISGAGRTRSNRKRGSAGAKGLPAPNAVTATPDMIDRLDLANRLLPRSGSGARTTGEGTKATPSSVGLEAADVFAEEPVPLTVFVTDPGYLGNPPLSAVQFEVVRHLGQVYLPATYELMVKEFGQQWAPVRFVNFLVIEWGKGSGKDHVARVAAAYVVYLLLCLRDPQGYFGMPRQDSIHLLNVAASEQQARRAFFEPLRRLIRSCRCFRDRFEMSGDRIAFDNGVELISGHSSAQTQEGLNLLLGIADEISAFRTEEEVAHLVKPSGRAPTGTAHGILEMMHTSGATRFPASFKVVAISYPRFKGDAIQQLMAEGTEDNARSGDRSRVFVSGPLATWEVNPRIPSKDVFRDHYERDPQMARAMYECNPDLRLGKVFAERAVHAAFDTEVPEPLAIEYFLGREGEEAPLSRGRPGWHVRFSLANGLRPIAGARYVIHGDIATRRNRGGVAMCHVVSWDGSPSYEDWLDRGSVAQVKLDFVASFEADLEAHPEREIQISWFRDLIRYLLGKGFDIARVTFDGYQSADTLQVLRSQGIDAKEVSTDRSTKAWDTLSDVVNDGRLEAYRRPRVVRELLGLVRLPGGKIRAASGGSKDEADAVACAVIGAIEVGGEEQPEVVSSNDEDPFGVGPNPMDAGWFADHGITSIRDLGPGRWPG